jgi:hypothetical protein
MDLCQLPLAFVVGAQRSGTTWVQRLLGAHPLIAAGQESHLFSSYLAPIWNRWWEERVFRAGGNRTIGLACYLTQDELIEAMRHFAMGVFAKLRAAKPQAEIFVEKTPDHALQLPLIEMLFPHSALIHVLRDGRDVVASLCSAHRNGWGRGWAPAKVADAARRWVDWVQEIRHQAKFFRRAHEIRFEDLLNHGPACLGRLFDFLKLSLPRSEVQSIYERLSFDACAAGTAPETLVLAGECRDHTAAEPEGFYRRGQAGAWRFDLTPAEQAIVHDIAGNLLQELGYVPAEAPVRAAA